MTSKRLYTWGSAAIELLSAASLFLIVALNLCAGTVLASSESDMVIERAGAAVPLLLWGALFALLLRGALPRVRPTRLFVVCAAAYLLMAAYLMANVNQGRLVGDTEAIYYAAYDFRRGDYSRMGGHGYLARYPYQLGLAAALSMAQAITESPVALRMMNVALVLLTNYGVCRAAMVLPGVSRGTVNLTIAFSFLIVPQLLQVLFIYGNIPSLCLLAFAVLALCAWLRGAKARWAAAGVALLSLAYLIRTNMLIACIAVAAVLVLAFLRTGKRRALAVAACALVCPLLLTQAVRACYVRASGVELDHPIPSLTWVAMGMQEDGAMAGWYNNYTDQAYYMNGYDTRAVDAQARHDIRERLYDFKQDPAMALRFYARKVASTWCEPTFGTLAISGLDPQSDCYTPLLCALYGGGAPFWLMRRATQGLLTGLYLLAALYPILRRRTGAPQSAYALFAQVYFFGGFAFHILWETKSLYALPYAVLLVPLAAQSVFMLAGLAKGRRMTRA